MKEKISFKHFSSTAVATPVLSLTNFLCNIGRSHHEEQFCEIILNLDQWFRGRCRLKIFLIWSSSGRFVQRSGAICAIFGIGYHEEHIIITYFEFGPDVQGGTPFKNISYLELWQPFLQWSRNIRAILVEDIKKTIL